MTLGALLAEANAHQHIDTLFGEIRNAVLAGDRNRNQLHFEGVSNVLRDVDVIALEAHVGAGRGKGREIGEHADIQHTSLGDVVDGIGMGSGCETENGAAQHQRGGKTGFKSREFGHFHSPC